MAQNVVQHGIRKRHIIVEWVEGEKRESETEYNA